MGKSQTKSSLQEEIPEAVTSKRPNHNARLPKRTWFGQPKGLYALAGTEVWERFSFYGMKGMFVLFLTAAIAKGGLGLPKATASLLVPLYGALGLLMCIPSGWLTDQGMNPRTAVLWGASLQCMGHLMLGLGGTLLFISGLWLLILGTGLLKGNISSMVGDLYSSQDKQCDRGFSIFYQGINIGAMLGPIVVGLVRSFAGFHTAFSAAGVGMIFSLATFVWGFRYYAQPPVPPKKKGEANSLMWMVIPITVLFGLAVIFLLRETNILCDQQTVQLLGRIATASGGLLVLLMLAFFYHKCENGVQVKRLDALCVVTVGIVAFATVFQLAATLFTTFTEQYVDHSVFGWFTLTTEQFEAFNPFFIITLAIPVASFWIWVKGFYPSLSFIAKIGAGLLLTGVSCAVLVFVATPLQKAGAEKPSFLWLGLIYFLQTLAELCIYTGALSFITKIAPNNMKRSYMAFVWLVFSLGSSCSGLLGSMASGSLGDLIGSFTKITVAFAVLGIAFILGNSIVKPWLHGAEDFEEEETK